MEWMSGSFDPPARFPPLKQGFDKNFVKETIHVKSLNVAIGFLPQIECVSHKFFWIL